MAHYCGSSRASETIHNASGLLAAQVIVVAHCLGDRLGINASGDGEKRDGGKEDAHRRATMPKPRAAGKVARSGCGG